MNQKFLSMAQVLTVIALCAAWSMAQNFTDVKPSPQQVAWQDLEIGAIIHFGPNTFLNQEWGDGTADPSVFNPTNVDPEQWIEAAKSAGIQYVVLVAKHHDGFCLWPTAKTPYGVKSSPWKHGQGDLVGDVATARAPVRGESFRTEAARNQAVSAGHGTPQTAGGAAFQTCR